MKTTLKLTAQMGPAVLKRLGEFIDTPAVCSRAGIIAGQAVASAVSEVFGDSMAVVYNDVDVFRVLTDAEKRGTAGRVLDTHNHLAMEMFVDSYHQLASKEAYHYQVARTRRAELLNEILCFGDTDAFLQGRLETLKFLSSFDLNCVQVGVDTRTQELIWTPEFEQFMATRQLLVSNIKTPVHTAIRWFRKKLELEGVYGHDETTMELLGAAVERLRLTVLCRTGLDRKLNGRLNFSTPYLTKLADVAGDIKPWFDLVQEPCDTIELYTLKARFTAPKVLTCGYLPEALLPTVARAYQGFWKKPVCEQILKAKDIENGSLQFHHLRVFGPGEFLQQHSRSRLARACNVLTDHALHHWTVGQTLVQKVALTEKLTPLVATRGLWAYGVMGRTSCPAEWANVTPDAQSAWLGAYLDEQWEKMTQARSIAPLLPTLTLPGNFRVTELTRLVDLLSEGVRMHHCVAGYYSSVVEGQCRIVSLQGHKTAQSLTVQLVPQLLGWKVGQVKGASNREPTEQEREAARKASILMSAAGWLSWAPMWVRTAVLTRLTHSARAQARVQRIIGPADKVSTSFQPRTWRGHWNHAVGHCKAVVDAALSDTTVGSYREWLTGAPLKGGTNFHRAHTAALSTCLREWCYLGALRLVGVSPLELIEVRRQTARHQANAAGVPAPAQWGDGFDIPF